MSSTTCSNLAREAIEKSLEVREEHGYDFRSPLCIYELCDRAGVTVRLVDDVSMEGVYVALAKPTILLSSQRPLPRRAFTCAHELGHHVFTHGNTIDELRDDCGSNSFDPKEFLVDAFAGVLLMPMLGVKRAFAQRHLDPRTATPEHIYTVACSFGVGYETLLNHLAYGLQLIRGDRAKALCGVKLPQIRQRLIGATVKEPLVVVDRQYAAPTLDTEAGTLVLLPAGAEVDAAQLARVDDLPAGRLFRAVRPGFARASIAGTEWGVIVRVSRAQYSGLAKYRHLEETDDE